MVADRIINGPQRIQSSKLLAQFGQSFIYTLFTTIKKTKLIKRNLGVRVSLSLLWHIYAVNLLCVYKVLKFKYKPIALYLYK